MGDSYFLQPTLDSERFLEEASKNGCSKFVLLIEQSAGNGIPRNIPVALKAVIERKVANHKQINDLRFTRSNKIVVVTPNLEVQPARPEFDVSPEIYPYTSYEVVLDLHDSDYHSIIIDVDLNLKPLPSRRTTVR
ncbi:hypothetical protein JTE90_014627 [Oedothorax gibbosus]|uniref:Uncharacterized protein n=1 Tax=Oedothorax gibbosus TaxID=931172 RepID=A0AAV6VA65_9ARAC|nr:hypothetical protein JTE90_014627 [Oedothorax gibbosus]